MRAPWLLSPITYFVQAVDTEGGLVQADNKGRLYAIESLCGLLEGDLDCSCVVNIADVMAVASRWRTSCDNPDPDNNSDAPNYDPYYDLDGNRDMDIVDIMLVVVHWGETCQTQSSARLMEPSEGIEG